MERFFRNLLLGEKNELHNRYLIINPPKEWREAETAQAPHKYPSSTPQVGSKFATDNENVTRLVSIMGHKQWKVADLLNAIGLKDRHSFLDVYLTPAIQAGLVRMLYPNSPRHPRQRYLLTVKGQGLYDSLPH